MNSKKLAYIIKTKDVYFEILEDLNSLEEELFKMSNLTKTRFEEILDSNYSNTFNHLIHNYNRDNYISFTQGDALHMKKNLANLKNDLETLKVVNIQVAIDPSQKLIDQILTKFNSLKSAIILDIKVNPKLLGGIVVSLDGKYLDYSLKTKLYTYEF